MKIPVPITKKTRTFLRLYFGILSFNSTASAECTCVYSVSVVPASTDLLSAVRLLVSNFAVVTYRQTGYGTEYRLPTRTAHGTVHTVVTVHTTADWIHSFTVTVSQSESAEGTGTVQSVLGTVVLLLLQNVCTSTPVSLLQSTQTSVAALCCCCKRQIF